ncbi:MAG: response regulator transcription factor [Fimbriimonadales bacterium]
MASQIRVLVVDDEDRYRRALQQVLGSAQDITVVEMAKDGAAGLEAALAHDPDVILTDIEMPRMNGIEMIRNILKRNRSIECVVLTAHEENDTVYEAIRAGAASYLLKTSTAEEVIAAVRRAHKGEATLTPKIATMVLQDFRRLHDEEDIDDDLLYELSKRELEILELVAKGKRNKDIAKELCLAEKTVKNHVSNILKALHVNSRTEAAMKALKERLVGN